VTGFPCTGPDGEDLTDAVREKVGERPTRVFRLSKGAKPRRARRKRDTVMVVVYCKQGHKNVFEVDRGAI
jgi:hypothetical protein